LRKSIKSLEKNIRQGYDEIDERHQHKKELLKQLDHVVSGGRSEQPVLNKTARAVTLPAVGIVEASRVFLFGRKPKDVQITEAAAKHDAGAEASEEAAKLKESIELESLLIEAQYDKVLKMQRQLEALKAKASLSGGYKFRSAFVKIPYSFIQEAVESADRMVPRKDRKEVLIHLLDKESQSLEQLKSEQAELESWIDKKTPASQKTKVAAASAKAAKTPLTTQASDSQKIQLQGEIESLSGKVEAQKSDLKRTVSRIAEPAPVDAKKETGKKDAVKAPRDQAVEVAKSPKALKQLREERHKVEKTITKLIQRESELDQTEYGILEKRIKKIDEFMNKTSSKAGAQDLLVERERIESRLGELKLRRDFLNQELGRFNAQEPVKA
ncbi:MAG: hypothetical protein KBC91_01400, partial [Candidatus Omnitrophica bacterium]|nr:hypothetical protein [Candidatus Omnitrophota bacterium]